MELRKVRKASDSTSSNNPTSKPPVLSSTPPSQKTIQNAESASDDEFDATLRPLPVQVDVLQQKLKHLEEFHTETVKYYEKELAAKQRTIHQLTQANREFEKLCVQSVLGEGKTDETVKLQNENRELKRKVSEAEERCRRLQKENDELR